MTVEGVAVGVAFAAVALCGLPGLFSRYPEDNATGLVLVTPFTLFMAWFVFMVA